MFLSKDFFKYLDLSVHNSSCMTCEMKRTQILCWTEGGKRADCMWGDIGCKVGKSDCKEFGLNLENSVII